MKISRPIPSAPRPAPPKSPPRVATPAPQAPRADSFEVPRRNNGLSGGTVAPISLGGSPVTVSTPGSTTPAGQTPGQRAQANASLGSQDGTLATPGDFTREARLKAIFGEGAPQPGTSQRPGEKQPTISFDGLDGVPGRDAGRISTGRTAQASDEPAPTEADKPLGPKTEAQSKWEDAFKASQANPAPAKDPGTTSPEPREPSSGGITVGRIWAEVTRIVGNEDRFKTPAVTPQNGTRGTPDPDKDGGDRAPGTPDFTTRVGPSLADTVAAKGRQNSLPGEGSTQRQRVHASLDVAVREQLRQHTDGRIDPGEDAAPNAPGGGSTQPPPGSGIEQVDGTQPGDPKHPGSGEG